MRAEFAGALFHIASRENRHEEILDQDEDSVEASLTTQLGLANPENPCRG